ncbi:hypothetical protein ACEPAG_8579 [Sanghuangporus baumii]
MNDPRSMMIGWSALLFAAGTGYYFARKDLNERRKEQAKKGLRGPALDWREKIEQDAQRGGAAASETTTGAGKTATSPTPASASASSSASATPNPPPNPKAPPEGS